MATVVAGAVGLLAGPAAADPARESGDRRAAVEYANAPCDPDGVTALDASLATQLNSELNAKMRGYMSAYRVSCARMVVKTVLDRGLDPRAAVIAITTTIVEGSIDNVAEEVDHDSLGLFQQREPWGSRAERLNPAWATNAFLNKMLALYPNSSWMTAPIGTVCQDVQVSAYGGRYQPQAADAQIIVDKLRPYVGEGRTQFADMNADGVADLVQVRETGQVVVYWNVGGTFNGSNRLVATGFTDPARVRFADMNGDGVSDLLDIRRSGDIVVYWNVGGVFNGSNALVASGFFDPVRVKFADMNADRMADLVQVRETGQVVVYWNVGGTFTGSNALVATGFFDPAATRFVDMNSNGVADLVQVRDNGNVVVYWNVGGSFNGSNALVATGFFDPVRVKFADMNADRVADLVQVRETGQVVVYWNVGGTFTGSNALVATGFTAP
ncbi:FG-GAP repeat domain-containing protein [Polymorphospora rubra]|uniref:FG-GAP repeat domain-containing protein n=1 Tax=Polymorphospora rubra TaxID=338584 RepID=UPI001BB40AAB|nr:VCBS repeat-containing protein [Polymorphospora rubra]